MTIPFLHPNRPYWQITRAKPSLWCLVWHGYMEYERMQFKQDPPKVKCMKCFECWPDIDLMKGTPDAR